jgi:hypothetical protein
MSADFERYLFGQGLRVGQLGVMQYSYPSHGFRPMIPDARCGARLL